MDREATAHTVVCDNEKQLCTVFCETCTRLTKHYRYSVCNIRDEANRQHIFICMRC